MSASNRRTARWLVLAIGVATVTLTAHVSLPDTPSGRQFTQWLEVFNRGDRQAQEQYYQAQWPSRPSTVDALALRDQSGGFDVLRIEEATPSRLVALAGDRLSDAVVRLTFEVEPEPPHRIVRFGVQGAARPADLAIPRLTESDLSKTLARRLDELVANDQFAGAVLVAKNGVPIFSAAYGLADRERTTPNRLDTRFRNGSMSKMFTAVAVLSLVQAGKVGLHDSIAMQLPDYPNRLLATKVTIQHLLTHTGGTGDIFGPQFAARRLDLRSHQDYLTLYGTRDVLFEPGSRWAYSNYGFVLLAAVIEKVSGQSYYDYLRDHVYAAAGMTSTGAEPEDDETVKRAIGYMKPPRTSIWRPNTDTLPYRGNAAGGGYTTIEDLLRFANALTAHRLLNATYTAMLTTGKVPTSSGQYAYGFNEMMISGVRAVGHSGGAPGQSGELLMFPESGYVVAVLANMDAAAPRVSRFVANRVPAR